MEVSSIVSPIVESATDMAGGLGGGAVTFFETVFLNAEKTGVSSLGQFLLVTVGIGVAIGIMRWIRAKLPG